MTDGPIEPRDPQRSKKIAAVVGGIAAICVVIFAALLVSAESTAQPPTETAAEETTTTLAPETEDSLVAEIQNQADNDWGTTTTEAPPTTAAPETTAPPATLPPAPGCGTWSSQEEADAWMAAEGANHDTSAIDTDGDGSPCELSFRPEPAPVAADSGGNTGAPAPAATSGACWDCLAQCESGGNWHINTGNGFYGGLQFHHQTWIGFGGQQYASHAHLASREQQIAIAEKVLASQGRGAWPGCSAKGAW